MREQIVQALSGVGSACVVRASYAYEKRIVMRVRYRLWVCPLVGKSELKIKLIHDLRHMSFSLHSLRGRLSISSFSSSSNSRGAFAIHVRGESFENSYLSISLIDSLSTKSALLNSKAKHQASFSRSPRTSNTCRPICYFHDLFFFPVFRSSPTSRLLVPTH